MELTVIGKSPSWPDRGGACTGYLVRDGAYALLLDCGSGVFARLREQLDYLDVDAVLISHVHPDHVLDLVPFASALSYSPRQLTATVRPSLHLPPGGLASLRQLGAVFGFAELLERAFAASEYDPAAALTLGPITARFREVPHFIRAWAVELRERDGRRLVFGADCGPNDALAEFAAGAELLIVEATDPPGVAGRGGGVRGHMSPSEAGELGRRAGARRLLVSHFSDEADRDAVRVEAAAGFGREVELASAGATFEV